MTEIEIESVENLISFTETNGADVLVYRGQSCKDWGLVPTVYRGVGKSELDSVVDYLDLGKEISIEISLTSQSGTALGLNNSTIGRLPPGKPSSQHSTTERLRGCWTGLRSLWLPRTLRQPIPRTTMESSGSRIPASFLCRSN